MEEIRQDQEIRVISKEIEPIQSKVDSLIIKDEPSAKFGTDLLAFIVKAKKRLEERRIFFTKPIFESKKNIDNEFKAIINPLEKMEVEIKIKLLDYRRIIEEEAKKKQEELNKMAEKNGLPTIEAISVDNIVKSSIGSSFIVKRWTYKVIDEAKIPRDMFLLDEKKITNLIRAHTKTIEGISYCDFKCEGLEVFQEESISIRT